MSDPFLDTKPLSKALPPTLAHLMNDAPQSGTAPVKPKLSRTQNLFSGKRLSVVPASSSGAPLSLQNYRINGPPTPSSASSGWTSPMTGSAGLPTPGGSTIYQSNDITIRQPKLPSSPLFRANRPSNLSIQQTPLSNSTLNACSPTSNGFPFPALTPPLTPSHEGPNSPNAESPCEVRTPGEEGEVNSQPLICSDSPEQYEGGHSDEEDDIDDKHPETDASKYLSRYSLHPHFLAQYDLGEELGSGGFGFVVKAMRARDGLPVAVKFIFKDRVPSHGWIRKKFPDGKGGFIYEVIPTEVYTLQRIRHPGVVRFVDLFEDAIFFYLVSLLRPRLSFS